MHYYKSIIAEEGLVLQQPASELRIEHPEHLTPYIHVDDRRGVFILVAVAHYHRVVLELVEGFQRNALFLQEALDFLSLQFLLGLLFVLLVLLLLFVLLLLGAQVVLGLLLGADLDGCQPAVHLVVGRVVQEHAVLGDPGPAF